MMTFVYMMEREKKNVIIITIIIKIIMKKKNDLERRVGSRNRLVEVRTNDRNLLVNITLQSRNGVGEEQDTGASSSSPKSQSRRPMRKKIPC